MDTPPIRITTSEHSVADGSSRSALDPAKPPLDRIPIAPKNTLTPPAPIERGTSQASSITLGGQELLEAPSGEVVEEPFADQPDDQSSSEASDTRIPDELFLAPVSVHSVQKSRYNRRIKIGKDTVTYPRVPAENLIPYRPSALGKGWRPFVHPEGQLYFRYENFFTNVYLYDKDNLRYIDATVSMLRDRIRTRHEMIWKKLQAGKIEIGLDLDVDQEDQLGCYYLCDTELEEVFWLSECDEGFYTIDGHVKILGREHLRLAARAFYWTHVDMFPYERQFPAEAVQELKADLSYYILDKVTSRTSTAPHTVDELNRFLQIVNGVSPEPNKPIRAQYMAAIARLSYSLMFERFKCYEGEGCAQLDSAYSVYDQQVQKPSLWFRTINVFLFLTSEAYLERLNSIWVDKKANVATWRTFIGELQDDWTASITPAVVILAANVGFLAIQSIDQVDENDNPVRDRSVGQIVSYISTIFSIGNILACTILARPHRPSMLHYAEDATNYLTQQLWTTRGVERLAIVLSIPTATFIWALLTFFIAITWLCFHDTSIATSALAGIVLVCVAVSAVVCLSVVVRNSDWTRPVRYVSAVKKVKGLPQWVVQKFRPGRQLPSSRHATPPMSSDAGPKSTTLVTSLEMTPLALASQSTPMLAQSLNGGPPDDSTSVRGTEAAVMSPTLEQPIRTPPAKPLATGDESSQSTLTLGAPLPTDGRERTPSSTGESPLPSTSAQATALLVARQAASASASVCPNEKTTGMSATENASNALKITAEDRPSDLLEGKDPTVKSLSSNGGALKSRKSVENMV